MWVYCLGGSAAGADAQISFKGVAFGSSIFAGGIEQMVEYFEVSTELLTLGLSLYVLGFAVSRAAQGFSS